MSKVSISVRCFVRCDFSINVTEVPGSPEVLNYVIIKVSGPGSGGQAVSGRRAATPPQLT